eukprot:TRINITY_DN1376_c0_g1_i1.p1 TRINITY_DN1376_c0_g1~~TRINITY_DN1376_c0_g1_i1.p1  ORF type:complete len:440 (+),score=133.17 TRINITY_DN1376_c0_g1_i1:78-1397(+)
MSTSPRPSKSQKEKGRSATQIASTGGNVNVNNNNSLISSTSMLDERILKVWDVPLGKTPVCKDLPRLAGRIIISGSFGKKPTLEPLTNLYSFRKNSTSQNPSDKNEGELPSTEKTTVRDFIQRWIKDTGGNVEKGEQYIQSLEKNTFVTVDGSIFLIPDEKWNQLEIPNELISLLKEAAKKQEENEKSQPSPLLKRTVSTFSFSRSSVEILDNVSEKNSSEETLENIAEKAITEEPLPEQIIGIVPTVETIEEPSLEHGVLLEVSRVIMELASRLETSERQSQIQAELKRIMSRKGYAEMSLVMESFFKFLGEDTILVRVFKAITQNIVFAGVYTLKMKVPTMPMTRDVRTREGWSIMVTFTQNIVSVVHRRREQSLATAPADEHYWFEWELRMVFDREVRKLESSSLRITDLVFMENTNAKTKEAISKFLSYGRLIIV